MTEGFGRKWKDFFYDLEDHHGLDVSNPSHIWLLHRLFLPAINEDALAWSEAWNSHKIQLDGERRSSPRQLYTRSSLTDGVRGLPPQDVNLEDYRSHGVDLGADENGQDPESGYDQPEWVNNVICEPQSCPLTDEQAENLFEDLAEIVNVGSKNMDGRRVVWVKAFELLSQLDGDGENYLP
jgi:hypothetical protein